MEELVEAFSLELDTSCNDRSYLFGRLLAIADKIESYARYLQTGGDDTGHERLLAVIVPYVLPHAHILPRFQKMLTSRGKAVTALPVASVSITPSPDMG